MVIPSSCGMFVYRLVTSIETKIAFSTTRQMTRGWVLLLLNIRLHVKGFNKLIYIGTFINATPRHVFLAFQTIKTRRFVLK